jgi:uncharacterized iron-regulated membrane protein
VRVRPALIRTTDHDRYDGFHRARIRRVRYDIQPLPGCLARWHFYAGLFALPFLIILAVTGALYLFHDEIDGLVYADLKRVESQAAAQNAPSALVAAALKAYPGTAAKYLPPASPEASAEVVVKTSAGPKVSVFVDPYDGRVLGDIPDKGTVMGIIRQIHGLAFFGPIANGLIEVAAGWTILLVATGVYLWWPRGQSGGVVTVRGNPKRRTWWRDVHAVTGLFAGFFILFLAVTGMPWSIVWGKYVNEWANGSNFGYPAGVRVAVPMSDEHLAHMVGPPHGRLSRRVCPSRAPPPRAAGRSDWITRS